MTLIWPSIAAAIGNSRHVARAPLTWDPTSHVLSRFSFGPTADSRATVARTGIAGWYAAQVAAGATYRGYTGHKAVAALGPMLALSPYDVRAALKRGGNEYGWDAMNQVTCVTLGLQTWSQAQLYETLVDFFSNHLNVANHSGDVWCTRHTHDRDVVRRYAMADFTSMLLASAKNPAMLTYLNLADSTKEAVNENYGRELLELHTVGRRYSESDVKNCARLLTGRTLDDHGHYLFDDYIHPTGKVKVLGFTHANRPSDNGEAAGDALLRYLASHPYTATNLARKLCIRFVSDTPSAALVAAVANAYLQNKTKIMPMVSTILRSTEFWESRGAKVRRPAENVIAAVRAVGPKIDDYGKATQTLHWVTGSMDHCPLDWPSPNGYPDVATAWRSAGSLLKEWNMHLAVAGSWWSGFGTVPALHSTTGTSGEAVAAMTKTLTGMTFSAAHLAAVQKFVGEPATTTLSNSRLRWLTEPTVALILHSPHHALR